MDNPSPSPSDYEVYKKCVKRWEVNFITKYGRIPSRYDIHEADISVRHAYKMYYLIKSQYLESTLSHAIDDDGFDLPLEANESLPLDSSLSVSFNETIEDTSSNTSNFSSLTEINTNILINLRNAENNPAIKVFEAEDEHATNENAWGTNLNKKLKKILGKQATNSHSVRQSIAEKLFPMSSFTKRNPRKAHSTFKSNESQVLSSTESLHTAKETLPDLETILIQKALEEKAKDFVNFPKSSNINVDEGWLQRCDDLADGKIRISNVVQPFEKKNFGLSNIRAGTYEKCKYERLDESDDEVIENSEDESDLKRRNIRHALKKRKVAKIRQTNLKDQSGENSAEQVSVSYSENENSIELMQVTKPKASPVAEIQSFKKELKAKATMSHPLRRRSRVTSTPAKIVNDSIPKIKGRKHGRQSSDIPDEESSSMLDKVMPEHYIDQVEVQHIRNVPQIDIKALKESTALFEEYVKSAVSIKSSNQDNYCTPTKRDLEREKLEKKIATGKLNENFVRIDVRKKVFVRGKKTVNYSKYKKSKWKKQKAANALAGPDMDMRGCDGGFLVCFNCGQQGHYAEKCKVKSDPLLPIDIEMEEESPYSTLEEAATMSRNKYTVAHSSHESSSALTANNSLDDSTHRFSHNSEATDSTAIQSKPVEGYIGQEIPKDFLIKAGLLNDSAEKDCDSSGPLYKVKTDGSTIDPPAEVYKALKLFGHKNFRKGQDKAVMRVLSGLSTLVTLSTGSGKSLCYQLPAYLYRQKRKCITLVVSPLVSLMEDQVSDVPSFLTAECLHSNQTKTKHDQIMQRIKSGIVDVLLISPEAIVAGEKSTGFGSLLRDLPPIAFVCIDEAHCMSQWSHNFRPSYLMICRVIREKFKVKTVLGLTATATLMIRESIVRHLAIPDGLDGVITDIPLPDNLMLTVSKDENRDFELLCLLRSEDFIKYGSIIIYCGRREECNRLANYIRTCMQDLQKQQTSPDSSSLRKRKRTMQIVASYHAGLLPSRRRTIQNQFMNGTLKIVVATIAFGMGINKPDIRAVIHYNMPMTFESYVQEIGRAGRDGLPASCHLFLDPSGNDKVELRRHIYSNSVDRHVIRKLLKKVFVPCACINNLHEFQSEIDAIQSMNWTEDFNDDMTMNPVKQQKCRGHEIGIPIAATIEELDIPEENIETLLNYLELSEHNYIRVLGKAYCVCKVISYGGLKILKQYARNCAPLAMAIAVNLKKDLKEGTAHNESSSIEFNVIEVASAIGWDSGMVKYHLKNLEWTTINGMRKRSPILVEFKELGFRIRSRGDLNDDELDEALNGLYLRVVTQEKSQLGQLNEVFNGLSSVAYKSFISAFLDESSNKRSDQLKAIIRTYFTQKAESNKCVQFDDSTDYQNVPVGQLKQDVRTIVNLYPENKFTGRIIARIFHGVASPVYPAQIWSRCKFWRAHMKTDFNVIVKLANCEIVKLRT